MIEPLQQGQLDGLCGLYALINALRVLYAPRRPLSRQQCKMLFATGISELIARPRSKDAAYGGMTALRQRKIGKTMFRSAALNGFPKATLRPALPHIVKVDELDNLLRAAILRRQVLLVCLHGRMSHHSVIVGTTAARIILFDSNGLQFIRKSSLRLTDKDVGSLTLNSLMPMRVG